MTLLEVIQGKRGIYCENCGLRVATELHHAIIRRSRKHKEYDCEENLELACQQCHSSGELDTYDHSCQFWKRQISRGYDMASWHKGLNLKTKEYYD